MREAVEWEQVRRLATTALIALGQSVELPPPTDAVYVRGRPQAGACR